MKYKVLLITLFASLNVLAQEPLIKDSTRNSNTNFHFQLTTVTQHKFAMSSPYTGVNSLTDPAEDATTITATIFWGTKLWKGASLYINPEIAGGSGISSAHGISDFTNGEAFRVGNPSPVIYAARAFLRQTINLDQGEEYIGEGANQVYKTRSKKYINMVLGKFSIADYFDNNSYSHDPRSQFFNWGLMSNGGWDYPANVRGYTWGLMLEYGTTAFKVRAATVLVPTEANGNIMDTNIAKANSNTLEVELPYKLANKKGIVRILSYYTNAHMGNYDLSIQSQTPDITTTRAYGRTKYGFGLNIEQAINDNAGLFTRVSWNDGKNETWAFTEIDRSVSLGILTNGKSWRRPMDQFGLAFVSSGISTHHRAYLAAGGNGFIIGDGALKYGQEWVTEIFYRANIFSDGFYLTPNYQFVANPAFNKDRGPAHVIGLRAHVEF